MRDLFYRILSWFYKLPDIYYNHRLKVLAYHDIKDENTFDQHIKFLSSRYHILTIDQLANYLENQEPLPKNSILLTFDDGDISVLDKGIPVLKKYDCPACVFIITKLIGTTQAPWFTTVQENLKMNGETPEQINQIMQSLKKMANSEREKTISIYLPFSKVQLNPEDLKEMELSQVRIGNHSHSHPMFNRCTERELQDELNEVKKHFDQWGIQGDSYFAYPNGNWNENAETVLKEKGIKLAFLFDHKVNEKDINPLRISRIRTNSDMSLEELKVKVSGLHSILQHRKL